MRLKDATVLVVDDEPDWRAIIRDWFEREGCRVLDAENGAEALHLVRTNRIDVVVSTSGCPSWTGSPS